ncbi:universal stress protein [Streptomyces sp. SP17BM10]|uniref:universal stress protein n=1 Tax=Streptomyces sp. SP17BM10 TaxID=3002530 RepID=UPI002E799B12|nr:universal stress protein [Streptomyces sp. SP17BM10]MEE1788273.1 universal stress protein [Streptomyces sp. SP17BM10]
MTTVVWLTEGTWPACVDAAREHSPPGADIVLLYVRDPEVRGAAQGSLVGLLGRGHPREDPVHPPGEGWGSDPGSRLEHLAAASGEHLVRAAAERLDLPCTAQVRTGRVGREVVTAAGSAGLLVLARDGDRTRPGPRSLGPATRYVVDHAPCPVLLVWP